MKALMWVGVLLALAMGVSGCATCQSCRGAEVVPSSQSWRPAAPMPRPIPPHEFATDPDPEPEPDAPDTSPPVPEPTGPEVVVPAPVKPRVKRVKGRAKATTSREVDGGLIIDQTAPGTIIVNSPGVAAPAGAPAAAQMAMAQPMGYPILPGPLPDAVAVGLIARVAGGVYYIATGKCVSKAAAAVQPAQAYAMVPTQAYQMVPMAMAPPTYYAAPMPAPQMMAPAPQPVYAAAPAPVFAAPVAPKKCRFFP